MTGKIRQRVRTIYTNDGECDDMNTFLHLLLYANDLEIEGIVYSSSCFHFEGEPERGISPKRWARPEWMLDHLVAYEAVYPNLVAVDPAYPSPDRLRSLVAIGNVKNVGEMDEVTAGSELIRRVLLSDKPGKIYIQIGGGTNTVARALKSIEETYRGTPEWEHVRRTVCSRTVLVMILAQDDTYKDYISRVWPEIETVFCSAIAPLAFVWGDRFDPPEALRTFRGNWMQEHLLSRGPLMARYHTWGDGHHYDGEEETSQFGENRKLMTGAWWGKILHAKYDMISEGDSPAFLYLLDRGLRSLDNPAYGGLGGRYEWQEGNTFYPAARFFGSAQDRNGDGIEEKSYAMSRWIADWMNDFAGRAAWSAGLSRNHRPEVTAVGGADKTAGPGQVLRIGIRASDPDGDALQLNAFVYDEAGTYSGKERGKNRTALHMEEDAASGILSVFVPEDAGTGDTIHVIVRCRDSARGEHPEYMTDYERIIITVTEGREEKS